ncbi:MAG: LTA synthase family protein [Butyrivibrio sp.]|jgi:phosphoglycerol transferase|uniref:LTA synthase family protein n=1 Tax=Butyrivibrio sp. TaxID=28121 RepID=UPI001EBD6A9B|nr:LTA synthase family protein [Butyrivibrio sp.]MBE5841663.1 LTA synthase family protein [Butyrivibrio sp.]
MKVLKSIIFRIIKILIIIAFIIETFMALVGDDFIMWLCSTYDADIVQIIYTINSPLKGANTDLVSQVLSDKRNSILLFLVITILVVILNAYVLGSKKINKDKGRFIVSIGMLSIMMVLTVYEAYCSSLILKACDKTLKISEYIESIHSNTHIYEEYYVKPQIDEITFKEKRNLIYIYIESLETTYASKEVGGYQNVNLIPHFTELAKDNICFSNSEKLGGFHSSAYTTWTMAALFASETGLPFSFPVKQNYDYEDMENMASGVISLGDILHEKGYYQEFLCGSDASFGGRRQFFMQHGNFEIYDAARAVLGGYITADDYVWWGVEDKNLYKIAKDELTRIAKNVEPFNFTMLTVDTHSVGGWKCSLCKDEYPDMTANIVACADEQLYDFIIWCQEQDWYQNTTIVIQGDHPRMDNNLVDGVSYYDRTIYNCFINSVYDNKELDLFNREYTCMDMFPTVLAAMGFQIPEDRLGLGTNLFSAKKTLAEQLGFEYINSETHKYSAYYIKEFS